MEHESNEHPGIESRLRHLGTEPLPDRLGDPPDATVALTRATARPGRDRRTILAAAAAVALVLGGGVS